MCFAGWLTGIRSDGEGYRSDLMRTNGAAGYIFSVFLYQIFDPDFEIEDRYVYSHSAVPRVLKGVNEH